MQDTFADGLRALTFTARQNKQQEEEIQRKKLKNQQNAREEQQEKIREFVDKLRPKLEEAAKAGEEKYQVKELDGREGIGYDKESEEYLIKLLEKEGLHVYIFTDKTYYAGYRHENPEAEFLMVSWKK